MTQRRQRDFAVALGMFALTLKLTVSANLLIWAGIPYSLEGGSLMAKIHPGTYAAALAMMAALRSASARPARLFQYLWLRNDIAVYFLAVMFCLVYAATQTGSGGLATLIDTFLPAGMIGLALSDGQPRQLAALRRLLRALFVMNAIVALGEAASGFHFVPVPTYADAALPDGVETAADFRPTAFYDHPLTGAAATMMGLLLRGPAAQRGAATLVCDAILFAALLAFGGRAAVLVFIIVSAGLYLYSIGGVFLRRCVSPRTLWTAMAVPAACVPIGAAAFACGLAGRLQAHLYWDPSAQSRVDQFRILARLTFDQLALGCRRADLLRLVEPLRLQYGVNAIEDFWLVIFATLGVVCFPVFVIGMAALARFLWRAGDMRGRAMVVALLIVASTSNSLGRKSILLMVLVACVAASGRGWVVDRPVHRRRPCGALAKGFA